MTITAGGNVGIGTTTPTAKLEIEGIAGTDGIKFPDGSLQTRAITILRATSSSFNAPSLAGGASTTVGVPVSGATVGSVVTVSPLSDLGNGIVIGPARVTSPGNIEFYVHNISNAVIDPPATQFTIAVTP